MTQEEKQKILRLLNPTDLEDHVKVTSELSLLSKALIVEHQNHATRSEIDFDNRILFQLLHSKIRHLIHLNSGVERANNGNKNVIDPTVQIILSRNIFETVVLFNMINTLHQEEPDQILVHKIWKLSTLNYRERIHEFAESPQAKEIVKEELEEIQQLEKEIRSSAQYVNAKEKSKKQIEIAVNENKFWTYISEDKINTSFGAQELCDRMTNDKNIMKKQYSRYSMFAHPSKESVNMFSRIFDSETYKEIVGANLRLTNCLISMMICDYVNCNPELKEHFEQQSKDSQILCSWYNKMIRSDDSSVNTAYQLLNG